jgi:3-isopropylmalate/(R)-2-methylmalate dehydratase small subunit
MEPIKLIQGGVTVLDRADVDTDQIIPAKYLKRVERSGFGEFLFDEWRKDPAFVLPKNPILATGPNFGTGSSREHAPWALQDYGFQAIVCSAFADIFFSNCLKIGLVPVQLEEQDVRAVMEAGRTVPFEIEEDRRHRLLNGLDDIALTLQQHEAISTFERDRERHGPVTTSL